MIENDERGRGALGWFSRVIGCFVCKFCPRNKFRKLCVERKTVKCDTVSSNICQEISFKERSPSADANLSASDIFAMHVIRRFKIVFTRVRLSTVSV
jgi:hypothetical protein